MAHCVTMSPPTHGLRHHHTVFGAKSQFDAHHIGPDKVKRRLIEDVAVVHLRALIAQEAEVDQTKAQEVAPKKAIEVPRRRRAEGERQSAKGPCRGK